MGAVGWAWLVRACSLGWLWAVSGGAGYPMAVPRRVKVGGPVLWHCGRQPEALGLAAVGPYGLGVRRGPWWGRWARARVEVQAIQPGGLRLGVGCSQGSASSNVRLLAQGPGN